MRRRHLFLGTAGALAAPRIVGAQSAASRTVRFVPQADVAVLDPVVTTATVTLVHGMAVFDTLYATDAEYRVQPQMVAGHVISADGREWNLTLREGLRFHDGEPVRARDCVASIRRWWARDNFGGELMAATDELSAPDDRTIRFRLRRPFPLLPRALGKVTSPMPAMMPERLASLDPARPVPEVVGSGPFRFLSAERVSGARLAYERFAGYVPRPDGAASRTAGPKVANIERVEWHILPDPATAAAALQQGEVDWLEYAPPDLLPLLRRRRDVTVAVTEESSLSTLRLNHLHPPFDNPGVRRAILGGVDQAAFMTAAFGEDRSTWSDRAGVFLPGTPMASEAGMEVLTGPRDMAKVRRELAAAGYRGEKVLLLQPNDFPLIKAQCEVAADLFRRAGMTVDVYGADWGSVTTRRASREPVERGGWSAFVSGFSSGGVLDPVAHLGLRANGAGAWFGWPDSPRLEALRQDWMVAPDEASQRQIAEAIQVQFWQDVPYAPIGQYFRVMAHHRSLGGFPVGMSAFWNVRRG
ncbi:ABC transporter substrate-binding protein [Roseomonas sp. CCTCC AB2023176]|uniref:ABC transporter substrate-binding protein n=1 Tax=Roseomonas sp. CCTCC AB2023176 TaxID=3342640 RepID=UPI0035DC2D33